MAWYKRKLCNFNRKHVTPETRIISLDFKYAFSNDKTNNLYSQCIGVAHILQDNEEILISIIVYL